MTDNKQPSELSIHLADTAAIGHINTGLSLYRAFEALGNEKLPSNKKLDINHAIELGVPAVTNLALGLELLLKVHHFQITGVYPFGHDIQKLGSSLPESAVSIIRSNYLSLSNDSSISKGVQFRFSSGVPGHKSKEWAEVDSSNYDLAIAYIGPMYVKWRYIYEEFQDDIDIRVSFAPLYFTAMSVHKAIRDYKGDRKVTVTDTPSAE